MIYVNLDRCDWEVFLFVEPTHRILKRLERLRCPSYIVERITAMLFDDYKFNTGFTFSNNRIHQSVTFIGKASSTAQWINTLCHEQAHLATHIAKSRGITLGSEEYCYLIGYIAERIFCKVENNIVPLQEKRNGFS